MSQSQPSSNGPAGPTRGPWIQLPLFGGEEGFAHFRLNHAIYQDGQRYTHKIRWFLAEMSVVGLHREEVARGIGEALRNHEPYKYTRTKLRGQADLVIHVLAGALDNVLVGGGQIAAIITPSVIPSLHQRIVQAIEDKEKPPTIQAGGFSRLGPS